MTLYTLDIKTLKRTRGAYLIISAVVLACDIISEFFSHHISSPFSRSAFLIPLICGAAVYTFIIKSPEQKIKPGIWTYRIYNTGIASLTVGLSVKGALDVYGTSNSLVWVLIYAGFAMMVAAAAAIKSGR